MKRHRPAFTVMEVTIAVVLLSAAVVGVGQFVSNVRQGLRDRALVRQIGWEIENLREQIYSFPIEAVTVEAITAIPCSEGLRSQLADAHWGAEVQAIESPIQATQVTIWLKCTINEQIAEPERLTFWIEGRPDDVQ